MWLRDDVDTSKIDWNNLASAMRRYAETLPPGARRNAELDRGAGVRSSRTAPIYCFKPKLVDMADIIASKGERDRGHIAI